MARTTLGRWRSDDNGSRPHSARGWQTPSTFAATFLLQRHMPLRQAKRPASHPVPHRAGKAGSNRQDELTAG